MALSARVSALFEGVSIAFDAIRSNKVRAALTILGIAVGVLSITTISAAIYGINKSVAKDIESAGATTFFVTRWPIGFNACDGTEEMCPWIHNPGTSFAEMTAMGRLPSVEGVTGEIDFNGSFKYGDRALPSAQLTAYTPLWEQITAEVDDAAGAERALLAVKSWADGNREAFFGRHIKDFNEKPRVPSGGWAGRWDGVRTGCG